MRPFLLFVLFGLFRGSIFAQADLRSEARQFLIEASTLIKDAPEFQQESTVANVSSQLARAGDLTDALGEVHLLKPQQQGLAILALEQAEAEDPAAYTTLQLWEGATGGGIADGGRAREFAAVTYGLLGDFVSAERIVSSIQEPEDRVWPLWNLTSLMVSKGHAQEAFGIAHQEEAAYPKVYALLGTASGILDQIESEVKAESNSH